ncbi:MAG: TOBE domain-containing protein, partial [Casimicrobiaceae bacterium]
YVTHDQVEALTLADRIAVMNDSRLVDVGTAQSLYQQPPSNFTATFVGNANLLPVTVEACDPAQHEVRVRLAGHSVTVHATETASQGDVRTLCIRPHALALEPPVAGANAIEATVVEVQWRGSAHRLYLEVDGIELRADSKPLREPPRRGDRLTVHFAAHDATLLVAPADERAPGPGTRKGAG